MSETAPKSSMIVTSQTVLAVLAVIYTLYFARDFLLPIVFAILLNFLLSPAVRLMGRFRIPTPLAALLLVLGLLGGTSLAIYKLSGSVQSWIAKAPQALTGAQTQIRKLMRPLERVSRSAEEVQNAAGGSSTKPPEVVVRGPSLTSRIFGSTQRLLAKVLEVILLLYFLLAAGDLFLRKVIRLLPHLHDKMKAVRIAREIETAISTYLLTNTATNALEGVMVTLALWALGMPNPILWGVLATLFEFIPYLGALAMFAILSVAAIDTFQTLGHAALVPGAFLLANIIQANVVSPIVMGRALALNTVALFIGLSFWFWIWGIPGAFIAVPLLAILKICCDHIEGLGPVGSFLGGKEEEERPALPSDPAPT